MTTKYNAFITNLPKVKNELELAFLISSLGITENTEKTFPGYTTDTYKNTDRLGIWRNPLTLATLLWKNKSKWKDMNSILEIGTFSGTSFFVILNFLKTFGNANITAKTIDIVNIASTNPLHDFLQDYFECGTSDTVKDQTWDLVFIDGSAVTADIQKDYDNVKNSSKTVVFMNCDSEFWTGANSQEYTKFKSIVGNKKINIFHTGCKEKFLIVDLTE